MVELCLSHREIGEQMSKNRLPGAEELEPNKTT